MQLRRYLVQLRRNLVQLRRYLAQLRRNHVQLLRNHVQLLRKCGRLQRWLAHNRLKISHLLPKRRFQCPKGPGTRLKTANDCLYEQSMKASFAGGALHSTDYFSSRDQRPGGL